MPSGMTERQEAAGHRMPAPRTIVLTILAMIAFAGNSLLCRLALRDTGIDAASFTSIRIVSGALVLWLITRLRGHAANKSGSWGSALALFLYASCFSFAYLSLSAGTGALLLFGAVQVTMLGYAAVTGDRIGIRQATGLLLAFGGLVVLSLPAVSTPTPLAAVLMLAAGGAWGVYSLRGKRGGDATVMTAGNFLRAVPFALALSLVVMSRASVDAAGLLYAVSSGALASGLGYAIWYTALKSLSTTDAAVVQLSVPVIAAVGGILFLDESVTVRFVVVATAVLGGIALATFGKVRVREQR